METLFDFAAIRGDVRRRLPHGLRRDARRHRPLRHTRSSRTASAPPPGTVRNGTPLPDFGGHHPDPNLVHATRSTTTMMGAGRARFRRRLGRRRRPQPDHRHAASSSPPPTASRCSPPTPTSRPATPTASTGIARSMPTSAAADRVADAARHRHATRRRPAGSSSATCSTPAWRRSAARKAPAPAPNHVREKDGLWAVLLWLNILAVRSEQRRRRSPREHWARVRPQLLRPPRLRGRRHRRAPTRLMAALRGQLADAARHAASATSRSRRPTTSPITTRSTARLSATRASASCSRAAAASSSACPAPAPRARRCASISNATRPIPSGSASTTADALADLVAAADAIAGIARAHRPHRAGRRHLTRRPAPRSARTPTPGRHALRGAGRGAARARLALPLRRRARDARVALRPRRRRRLVGDRRRRSGAGTPLRLPRRRPLRAGARPLVRPGQAARRSLRRRPRPRPSPTTRASPRRAPRRSTPPPLMPKAIVAVAPPRRRRRRPPLFRPGGLIYEVNVRAFTMLHPDVPARASAAPSPRSPIPRSSPTSTRLGVDAVELMPIAAWIDERHLPPLGLRQRLGLQSRSPSWRSTRASAPAACAELARDRRRAARRRHRRRSSTSSSTTPARATSYGPTLSLRGLDERRLLPPRRRTARLVNDTGTGNTLACDHPATRAPDPRHPAPLRRAMPASTASASTSPRSSAARPRASIADAADLRRDRRRSAARRPRDDRRALGHRPGRLPARAASRRPGSNGTTATATTSAASGAATATWLGELATAPRRLVRRLRARPLTRSVNFVAAHDGFTLADLVAYRHKHNEANGEHNRDGHGENLSWNNGVEGADRRPRRRGRAPRDLRALLATLFASRGTIMLTAGDEFGRTPGRQQQRLCPGQRA